MQNTQLISAVAIKGKQNRASILYFCLTITSNLKPSELDSLLPDATCPDEWLKFNCSCYQISGNGSWDEGREHCMRKGGDLVQFFSNVHWDIIFCNCYIWNNRIRE
uniref:C-type lectin domain-containing protein n=1 Tax=Xiphophorus couchianus TaxID=32473 RepID=A0A3B5MUC1_9TELE